MPTETPTMSVRMALDALAEQCAVVDQAKAELERQMALRDHLIQEAREARIPWNMLRRITKLSRDRLTTIANKAPIDVPRP